MIKIIFYPSFAGKLRNAEHYDLFFNIAKHFRTSELKPSPLMILVNRFLHFFDKEDDLYKRSAKQEDTLFIKELHEKRKTSFMAFKRINEASTYSETLPIKEAAEALLRLMENYSAAYYAPMTEASALIVNLIEDLEKSAHTAQIALVAGAAEALAHLKRDNDAFMELYTERTLIEGEQKEEGTQTEARRQTDHKFVDVVDGINIFYLINELSPTKDPEVSLSLGNAIHFINAYLQKYETILSRRNPKYRPNKPDTDDDDDDEVPGDQTPIFAIAAQGVTNGSTMYVTLTEPDSAADLFAQAVGATLILLLDPEAGVTSFDIFPITGLELSQESGETDKPIGLKVGPQANSTFDVPTYNAGPCQAWVEKDDVVLAYLTGAFYPGSITEGRKK
ncbi:MAG: DUF6261 family protein [Tannerellaceae bacterium]|jgi:hypothetical protein|nr:DUF6261 family protein [Tannerellaceae bacterium]